MENKIPTKNRWGKKKKKQKFSETGMPESFLPEMLPLSNTH